MDNDEFNRNFGEFDRHAAASSEIGAMDIDSIDFNSELRQIEREINCCKPTLQSCHDEHENIETEICDVKQLQRKARFILDNVQSEEKDLHERFKNLHLNYEACVKRSGGYEDSNEMIRAKINELTTQRKTLMEDLTQLRRNVDDNGKKLARVKAMITEQEEKNVILLRRLKEISESAVSISPDVKERIDTILKCQEIN